MDELRDRLAENGKVHVERVELAAELVQAARHGGFKLVGGIAVGVSLALAMTGPAVSEHAYQDMLQVFLKDGRLQSFSLKDLESFPQITFTSFSPWTEGVHEFTGIPLKSFVEQFDPSFTQIELTARDNYQVTFAAEDLMDTWPILAIYMNGDPISPRTKGPFWVVFPFDDYPELQREDLYARSIWQVQHLKIE